MLIIAATFLVYWPALRNGFVWDDTALVLRDPLIRSWVLIPEGFRHFLFLDATASNFYRPIQRLTFVADYQFFGLGAPAGWHFTSILVHALAGVGLFFVAEKLLALSAATRLSAAAQRAVALGVAVLWVIHPLHTSAVTYIAGRADPLAAMFGFAGLALGLASFEPRRRVGQWRVGAALGFGLAVLSKESGITFTLIWLLVLAWRRPGWRVAGLWLALLAVVIGGYCALRFTAAKTPPPVAPPVPVAVRPILAARAFAEYASLVVAPVTLRMERDVSTKPQADYAATMQNARRREYQTLAGVLLLLGFALWVRFAARREPVAAFCLGAFAVAYLPISNVFSLNATVAEHWLYVPSAFLFLATALTILALKNARHPERSAGGEAGEAQSRDLGARGKGGTPTDHRGPSTPLHFARDDEANGTSSHLRASAPLRLIFTAVLIAWVLALEARTFLRQADWRDQRTFIERTIAAGGASPRMLMNLANVESAAREHEKAVALYREALRQSPDQPIIWLGFANILARQRDVAGARAALAHAESSPLLVVESGQLRALLDEAELGKDRGDALRAAIQHAPRSWGARRSYVDYLIQRGDKTAAIGELRSFLETQPFRAETWRLLAAQLESAGRNDLALSAYREARRRDVRDEEARAALQRLGATN